MMKLSRRAQIAARRIIATPPYSFKTADEWTTIIAKALDKAYKQGFRAGRTAHSEYASNVSSVTNWND